MAFAYDGGGLGKGGTVTLFCDGMAVGTGRVEQTEPMAFSADEACDVGSDTGSPTSPDYGAHGNAFTGQIDWVKIDIGADSHDHLVTTELNIDVAAVAAISSGPASTAGIANRRAATNASPSSGSAVENTENTSVAPALVNTSAMNSASSLPSVVGGRHHHGGGVAVQPHLHSLR